MEKEYKRRGKKYVSFVYEAHAAFGASGMDK